VNARPIDVEPLAVHVDQVRVPGGGHPHGRCGRWRRCWSRCGRWCWRS
jgi:hypothetical protein